MKQREMKATTKSYHVPTRACSSSSNIALGRQRHHDRAREDDHRGPHKDRLRAHEAASPRPKTEPMSEAMPW